ncbi:hypothetical protein ABMA32_08245 [Mesorhizobium sp. VNQ89]|uniref:hypothetical protein n=1 Tax=Mesorhizobium quangtriensis TaxID=3157709 RepID=UPI0032B72CC9
MPETLLSPSNVLLFGREMGDLAITIAEPPGSERVRHASTAQIDLGKWPSVIDGYRIKPGRPIFLKDQQKESENGLYVNTRDDIFEKYLPDFNQEIDFYYVVVTNGIANENKLFKIDKSGKVDDVNGDSRHGPFNQDRIGFKSQLESQLTSNFSRFARIYAFSYEGYFYELPRPILFLVHGKGLPASEAKIGGNGRPRPARAPGEPSLTGLGAADFQFADELMVWSYDKADYTIRMDVETGMFEDVLLAAMLGGGPGGMDSAGMNARGMNARGMNARGMNARGMNARGMNARGSGNSD